MQFSWPKNSSQLHVFLLSLLDFLTGLAVSGQQKAPCFCCVIPVSVSVWYCSSSRAEAKQACFEQAGRVRCSVYACCVSGHSVVKVHKLDIQLFSVPPRKGGRHLCMHVWALAQTPGTSHTNIFFQSDHLCFQEQQILQTKSYYFETEWHNI